MVPTSNVSITLQNRLTLSQAATLVGKSPSCIFRWWRDGVHGIHLECLRLGRSLFTSEAALEQFGREVAAAHAAKRAANASSTSDDHDLNTNVNGL